MSKESRLSSVLPVVYVILFYFIFLNNGMKPSPAAVSELPLSIILKAMVTFFF